MIVIYNSCNLKSSNRELYSLFKNTPVEVLADELNNNDEKTVIKLLNSSKLKKLVNYKESKFGYSLLFATVRNNQLKMTELLIKNGAEVNSFNHEGQTPLIQTCDLGSIDDVNNKFLILKCLLKNGANPNLLEFGNRDKSNSTRLSPLMALCGSMNTNEDIKLKMASLLFKYNANPNLGDEFENTPLNLSLFTDNYNLAAYLIQEGADFNKIIIDRSKFEKGGEKVYICDFILENKDNLSKMKSLVKVLKKNNVRCKIKF